MLRKRSKVDPLGGSGGRRAGRADEPEADVAQSVRENDLIIVRVAAFGVRPIATT